ncbi:hypothetical protein Trydic_g23976 [Trypoxylus dichotomus]
MSFWTRKTNELRKSQNFYYYFRPIAIFCRILGVLPLKNLNDCSCQSLEFRYLSASTIYTLFLFIVCTGVSLYFFDFTNLEANILKSSEAVMWRFVVIALMIARAFMYCFFCVNRSKKYVKLIKLLDLFDKEKNKKNRKTSIVKDDSGLISKVIIPVLIGGVTTAVTLVDFVTFCYLTLIHVNSQQFPSIWYVSFAILGLWQVLPLYLYIYFAFAVKNNFKTINKICLELIPIRKMYLAPEEHQPPSNMKEILRDIRLLYVLMIDTVKSLNSSYGVFLAIDQFYIIVTFVVNLYVFFFTSNKDMNLLYFLVVNVSVILAMVFVSHDITGEANKIAELMQKLPVASLDMDSKLEIQMLLSQIFATPIHISAAGYFKMDREQIPSVSLRIYQ